MNKKLQALEVEVQLSHQHFQQRLLLVLAYLSELSSSLHHLSDLELKALLILVRPFIQHK